jgi:4,5-dihydroxyphthalate decarboxylase
VIIGNDAPDDPDLRPVFPDPAVAADAFWQRHGFVPVNHMATVRRDLAERRPDLVEELLRLFRAARLAGGAMESMPMTRAALRPAVDLALRYATDQGLLPLPLGADAAWEGA